MRQSLILGAMCLTGMFSQASSAAVVCNYCTISSNGASPTAITFAAGDNVINTGLATYTGPDARFFTFSIAEGEQLSAIMLDSFTSAPLFPGAPAALGVAFFGLKQGTSITPSTTNPAAVDGYTFLGTPTTPGKINGVDATPVGQNLFPNLIASGQFTGTTLSNPLGAGSYTIWLRESRTVDIFSLNFQVTPVPVPSAVWLLGSAMLGLVGFKKRKG